jgi:hypothetical protein
MQHSHACLWAHLLPHLQVRVGIHTGPVVTGLIGTKLPKYSVVGGVLFTEVSMKIKSAKWGAWSACIC